MAGPLVSSHARQQVTAALRSKTPRIILGYAIIGAFQLFGNPSRGISS